MDLTTLSRLSSEVRWTHCRQGMRVPLKRSWVVPGEERLSYTTIVRLVECCREMHWDQDVALGGDGLDTTFDSISRALECDFRRPVLLGKPLVIHYHVGEIGRTSYTLILSGIPMGGGMPSFVCKLVIVLVNRLTLRPVVIPAWLRIRLDRLAKHRQSKRRR